MLSCLILCSLLAFGDEKVATIDFQQAIVATDEGVLAAEGLSKSLEATKAKADKAMLAVTLIRIQMEDERNEEARAKLQAEAGRNSQQALELRETLRKEVERQRVLILYQLGAKMHALIDEYAKEHGYAVVIDKGSPDAANLYVTPDAEITAEMVKRYNAAHPVK